MANPIKFKAVVLSIDAFGSGTYLVTLLSQGIVPRFKAGQFLHLAIDEYDPAGGFWPESRVFSIASAPGEPKIKIFYSIKGRYTHRMKQELAIGKEVWLKLPYGNFIIDSLISPEQDVILIAGGTGISPYLPYLEKLLSEGTLSRKILLYYGVRENIMLFAHDLLDACGKAKLIETNLFIENEAPNELLPISAHCEKGRLDINRIIADSTNLHDVVFFISGPPSMIISFKKKLIESGLDLFRIKTDEWE